MTNHEQAQVVSLAEREQEKRARAGSLCAEALFTGEPSPEGRAYYDAELDADPEAWRSFGDLAAGAIEIALQDFWFGYATKASVLRGAEALRSELGHADASAAERVLIEHAVLCHVRLGMCEHLYSRAISGDNSADTIEHYEKRLTQAQKRFTRAVTTLARVRGLLARADAARDAASRARTARPLVVLKQMAG